MGDKERDHHHNATREALEPWQRPHRRGDEQTEAWWPDDFAAWASDQGLARWPPHIYNMFRYQDRHPRMAERLALLTFFEGNGINPDEGRRWIHRLWRGRLDDSARQHMLSIIRDLQNPLNRDTWWTYDIARGNYTFLNGMRRLANGQATIWIEDEDMDWRHPEFRRRGHNETYYRHGTKRKDIT